MSMQSGEIRSALERITAAEAIRRVEKHDGARDFHGKNKDARNPEKDQSGDPSETPVDIVELSQTTTTEHTLAHPDNTPKKPVTPDPGKAKNRLNLEV